MPPVPAPPIPQEYTVKPCRWCYFETLLREINAFRVSVPVSVSSLLHFRQEMSGEFFNMDASFCHKLPRGCPCPYVVVLHLFGALKATRRNTSARGKLNSDIGRQIFHVTWLDNSP